ncbi:sulfite exporter TauE/SafE family protein [Arthrobacter sp. zg-Y820]|uniref:sulfite exporter TauE/SafE family protein n=1 Tax=unclassified Arthrobacter TaxID=235627 RepID=UPI001E5E6CA8|nr:MULTISPECIES: sulfite exporter TauE/SafE family protein [unclassified Arthrobacter]MCC9197618.1 sulfite exporter TauE/SafE family protein [Arthrobacter sp. zg-Y820]MDK1280485.1 sulfite exporter TauE/SafE family protein [Arthrobacter sp. zg.Y820]WIB10875.1 sulfite exporter TauE/SafE family protein [Arthrobacter sp. zg-Y820]
MTSEIILLTLLGTALACTLSASAGLGGSLVLVPMLALAIGTKEGVALAALLLAANNLVKLVAYRGTIPWGKSLIVLVLVVIGSAVGAALLIAAPETWVSAAVVLSIVLGLGAERLKLNAVRKVGAPVLALASGATSGFSGTSGPLKGVALRLLNLDRSHLVGAASIVSLAGDAMKAGIYAGAGLLSTQSLLLMTGLFPVMIASTFFGRYLNSRVGERGYAVLFWTVMGGYSLRLLGFAP